VIEKLKLQARRAKNQQLQEVERQKSTTRFRVNNQLMIDFIGQFY
jgi:hypothetical protein